MRGVVAFGDNEIVQGLPLLPTLHQPADSVEGVIESFLSFLSSYGYLPYCRKGDGFLGFHTQHNDMWLDILIHRWLRGRVPSTV